MIADVVIIGGGVIGWSVAHHLARTGAGRIMVVDAGKGSTERATGGFRAQFATEVNVRLSLLSLGKLRTFQAETGVDPGYASRIVDFLNREALVSWAYRVLPRKSQLSTAGAQTVETAFA